MVRPDFDSIKGECYNHLFAEDSILCRQVDEVSTQKLLTKQDLSCLKRIVVKFRLHLKESKENIELNGNSDILLDHAVFISELMIKRTEAVQAAAKHEKDKNARSDTFMETVSLFKKGLIAFENQQAQLRRHLARLEYSKSEEGAAYFKLKAKEELSELVKERIEEYKKREAELEKSKEEENKEPVVEKSHDLANGGNDSS